MSGHVRIIEQINIYPLTGARAIQHDVAVLGPGGFEGDRQFVLYEPSEEGNARVSQKQYPVLAQLQARVEDDILHIQQGAELVGGGVEPWKLAVPALARTSLVGVVEFGDATPCYDMGAVAADKLSELLQTDVRLARKTDEWMSGGGVPPAERANATLHVGSTETARALADRVPGGILGTEYPADRLRANLVVSGFPPFEEAEWIGGVLLAGGAMIEVDRLTERCPVPGRHQRTGINMKDLPKAYPYTVRAANGKPTIGVYGHIVGTQPATIRRGDEVTFVDGNLIR
jgi:uncharacterized protein YcbX